MSDKTRIDEDYQAKKGYQPTPKKPKKGGMAQDGYKPTKSVAKPAPNPPPKKP
jgi:hypothetical protein